MNMKNKAAMDVALIQPSIISLKKSRSVNIIRTTLKDSEESKHAPTEVDPPSSKEWSCPMCSADWQTPNGVQIGPIRVPVANTYDVDNEYDNIMNKALRSYKLHRDKERADTRQKLLKTAYKKRWHVPHAPSRPVTPDRKPRPKSSLPPKMDAIKEVLEANTTNGSYDSTEPKKPVDVKRVTLSMDAPSMSNSYMRRNQQTSQSWYSHSCPSTSYLNNHMMRQYQSSGSASPSSSTSSKSYSGSGASTRASYSPQLKKKTEASPKKRPESAKTNYSYDGGIFVPNKPKHDYFVIHPDWVSEAMSIQKLSLKERRPVGRTGTWPGRRCKSAPPPKLRNPITWDVVHGEEQKY